MTGPVAREEVRGADGRTWRVIRRPAQRWEAEMLQQFLVGYGVACWVITDDEGGQGIPMTGGGVYPLLVRAERVDEATALLASGRGEADESS